MRYLWDEDRVKNILLHMRGLQSAVSLNLRSDFVAAGSEKCRRESRTGYGINIRKPQLAVRPHRGCERASLF